MSEDWTTHACDVRLRNLSQEDGYNVLVPLLIKEMEARVANPFWDESYGDDSSVELASDDEVIPDMNNTDICTSDNDNIEAPAVTLGSFEEVLNSIKVYPTSIKKAVNKDAIKGSDPVSPPNIKDKVNRNAIKESDIVIATNVKKGVNQNAIKESDIVLESIDRDKVFDSESSEIESDDGIEFGGEKASNMPKLLESFDPVESACSNSSDVMEIIPDVDFPNAAVHDPNDDTRWELNTESGEYEEVGSNPKGFKLKKMNVMVKEEHVYNKHLSSGPVKVRVKLRNVRKQLGMLNKSLDESIIVENRTDTSHPFICPFYCPVYNVPCDAMFRVTDQQFFIEHVSNRNCPYAPRAVSPVEPLVQCEKCGDDIPESKLKEHMDDNHHTHTCPGCKQKFECKIDVEDHIINEHATHFMSNIPKIYRRTPKEPPTPPAPIKTYASPIQLAHNPPNAHQPTPQLSLQSPVVSLAQSIRLAPPQGVSTPGPRFVMIQQPPQQVTSVHLGQRVLTPVAVHNGQARVPGGQILQISPGLALQLSKHAQPTPPPPTPVLLPSNAKLQQLKLPSGQLVWAQPVSSEPIPGSDKAKIQFKIIGPVNQVPKQAPSVIQMNPHNPHAPTTSYVGPTRVPTVPTSTLTYRPIIPKATHSAAPDPQILGFKPVRIAQPLQLLHLDRDGAPVYQHNGFQPGFVQLDRYGAPVNHKSKLEDYSNPGGGYNRIPNGMKQTLLSKQISSPIDDHDYNTVDPLEEEGVDPLEGLDPYEDEGVDPLAGDSRSSTPIILLDDCPEYPEGDEDTIDISSLCQAQVEG